MAAAPPSNAGSRKHAWADIMITGYTPLPFYFSDICTRSIRPYPASEYQSKNKSGKRNGTFTINSGLSNCSIKYFSANNNSNISRTPSSSSIVEIRFKYNILSVELIVSYIKNNSMRLDCNQPNKQTRKICLIAVSNFARLLSSKVLPRYKIYHFLERFN